MNFAIKMLFLLFLIHVTSFLRVGCLQLKDPTIPSDLSSFTDVQISSRRIYLQWRSPQFALRTVLFYGQTDEDKSSVQIDTGIRNYTIDGLEPGQSYEISVQIYYSSANVEKIKNVITTLPIFPSTNKMKVEITLYKKDIASSESKLAKSILSKIQTLSKTFTDVTDMYIYSVRNHLEGCQIVLYASVTFKTSCEKFFSIVRDNLPVLGVERSGFSFQVFKGCCVPFFFHDFDRQTAWKKNDVINLRVIPNQAFVTGGICSKAVDLNGATISVETRGESSLERLTISLFVKLKSNTKLQPIISAVNYNTQLRLEAQGGRVVWMFYNIGNSQGFIIQTSTVLKTDTWSHVLVDYDSKSGVGRIFLDGFLQEKALSDVVLSSNWMLGLRIGNYFSGDMKFKLNGLLDNLNFFSCTMTQEIINTLANHCGRYTCQKTKKFVLEGPKVNTSPTTFQNKKTIHPENLDNNCNPDGTLKEFREKSGTVKCLCKKNVKGKHCDVCKDGTFDLNQDHTDGCLACYCNGRTQDCRSAQLERRKIVLNAQDITSLKLRSIDGSIMTTNYIDYNQDANIVSYKPVQQSSAPLLYWQLPRRYGGDKITSYGGSLHYKVSFLSHPSERPLFGSDVVLMGNGMRLEYRDKNDPLPGKPYEYDIPLYEKYWRLNGKNITRGEMLIVLSNIEAVLLRVMFSTDMIYSRLYQVELDVSGFDTFDRRKKNPSHMVEECKCPPQYSGKSCQHCNSGFTNVRNRTGSQCEQCQCHGHTRNCDEKTGKCRNCQHFTTGDHCERCLPGYYGDPRSGREDTCRPCPCPLTISSNQFSVTCSLQEDGGARCDACQHGYVGRQCERCVSPYSGDPTKPGDYCKISKESKCSDCDESGSIDSICDKTNGQCVCKKNVVGKKCSKCKEGTFHLSANNKDGCLSCWCSKVSSKCVSSNYFRRLISLVPKAREILVTDFEDTLVIKKGFYLNPFGELILTNVVNLPAIVLYWKMPEKFTMRRVKSYGGYLSYRVSYVAEIGGKAYFSTDVKLQGSGIVLLYNGGIHVENRQMKTMKVPLQETYWHSLHGRKVSRSDFMFVLTHLETILIRATYHTKTKFATLSHVVITDAVPFDLQKGLADSVERCRCPMGYTGLSCERCSKGYTRSMDANGHVTCTKCKCNGHSDECDEDSGICSKCKHYTSGDHCDVCKQGYYGDAISGSCRKCACPLLIRTNQFSSTCVLNDDGNVTCNDCQPGYTGKNCGQCANGYTGNPSTPGGTCQKASQRSAPSVTVTPERRLDRVKTSAEFKCTVQGEQPLTIIWSRIDGRPLPKQRTHIESNNNTKTLTIHQLTLADKQRYICSGRNDYGLDTATVSLIVVGYKEVKPIRLRVSPKSMLIEQGDTARFYCKDDSETTSTVTWTRETGNLPEQAMVNQGVLTITNIQRRHSGIYTCIGSNQHSTDRVKVNLQVGAVVIPRASVIPPYETVDVGDTLQFQCSVTGYPQPHVRWSRGKGKKIPRKAIMLNGNRLQIPDIGSEDEGDYICTASNRGGQISRKGLLFVRDSNKLPKINILPSTAVQVKALENVNVLCSTSSSVNSIKWHRKGGYMPGTSIVNSKGELKFQTVIKEDAGVYICTATNLYGTEKSEFTLTVISESGVLPSVSLFPKFQTIVEGKKFSINCNVTGQPAPVVLWSKPNGWLTNNHLVTGSKLHVLKATPQDGGTYICSGRNKFGISSSKSVISVERRVLPILHVDKYHKHAYEGTSEKFLCTAKGGIPKPLLFWQTSSGYRVPPNYVKKVDKNSLLLVFRKVYKRLEGKYTCVGINAAGKGERSVKLSVRGDPVISLEPVGVYQVTVGDDVVIKCLGYGVPIPALAFTFPTNVKISEENFEIKQEKGLIQLKFVALQNFSGVYSCTGVNRLGEKKVSVQVIVNKEDTIPICTVTPPHVVAKKSTTVKFKCIAIGTPNPKIYWTKDQNESSIAQGPVLNIESLSERHSGEYHCNANNRKGRSRVSALLEVVVTPRVKLTPKDLVVRKGHPFLLKCEVFGSPKPGVEWEKVRTKQFPSSLLISDTEMVVTAANSQHAGEYKCKASNIHGSHEAFVNVTVVELPFVKAVNETVIRANINSTITLQCVATGYPKPHIKWSFSRLSTAKVVPGAGILKFDNIGKTDQGQFKCQANNLGGFAEETFTLIVNELPKVYIKGGLVLYAMAGTSYSLQCIGQGKPMPSLSWSKIGEELSPNVIISNGGLHFQHVTSAESGRYRCLGKNPYGSVVAEVQFNVEGAPKVSVRPKSLKVNLKESAKFFCEVSGSPSTEVSWSKMNSKMPDYHFVRPGYMIIPTVKYEDSGIYICRAENAEGVVEEFMELKVNEFVPSFNHTRNSMIIYETIENALFKTSIEIHIRSENLDGLLLYNGRVNKDFISIGLVEGYVIFAYDLGSGSCILKSLQKIVLGKWTSIKAGRDGSIGHLQVDGGKMVTGKSSGQFDELNLKNELYVGGHGNVLSIKKQTIQERGFTGCIGSLVINGVPRDFTLSLKTNKVYSCDVCTNHSCLHGSECITKPNKHGYVCKCLNGYMGEYCEERVERCYPNACNFGGRCINRNINGYFCKCKLGRFGTYCEKGEAIAIPSFNNHSYISYKLPLTRTNSLQLLLSFKAFSLHDSLILSITQVFSRLKNFLQIKIEKNKVVLKYNLGNGPVSIESKNEVLPGQWTKIYVEQKEQYASLRVNNNQARKGVSRGRYFTFGLNARSVIFVGGFRDENNITKDTNNVKKKNNSIGLHGCVKQLMVNGVKIDLVNDFIETHKYSSCYKAMSPCLSLPCKNNGSCQAVGAGKFRCECKKGYKGRICEKKIKTCGGLPDCQNGAHCILRSSNKKLYCACPLGFVGLSCENALKIGKSIRLNEDGYLMYPTNTIRNVEKNIIEISIRTNAHSGLLLWYGQNPLISPDFLLIGIKNGRLDVQMQLGSGEAGMQSNETINDETWHHIMLNRTGAILTCMINGTKILNFNTPGINKNLDVYSTLYLGAGSSVSKLSRGRYNNGFQGCLRDFKIENKIIDFKSLLQEGMNVQNCS